MYYNICMYFFFIHAWHENWWSDSSMIRNNMVEFTVLLEDRNWFSLPFAMSFKMALRLTLFGKILFSLKQNPIANAIWYPNIMCVCVFFCSLLNLFFYFVFFAVQVNKCKPKPIFYMIRYWIEAPALYMIIYIKNRFTFIKYNKLLMLADHISSSIFQFLKSDFFFHFLVHFFVQSSDYFFFCSLFILLVLVAKNGNVSFR